MADIRDGHIRIEIRSTPEIEAIMQEATRNIGDFLSNEAFLHAFRDITSSVRNIRWCNDVCRIDPAADPYRQPVHWLGRTEFSEEATQRAEILLISCLTKRQREAYPYQNAILVKGSLGGNFAIRKHSPITVWELSAVPPIVEWCLQPVLPCPIYDVMLLNKLWIETDEAEYKKRANCTWSI